MNLYEIPPPKILQVQPTNHCNLYCLFCDHRIKTTELTDEKWAEIVNEAGKMGIDRLTISGGGEPMARREATLAMMEIAKINGMKGDIVTNGTLFTDDDVKKIIEIGWDSIVISIHGVNSDTDDYLRGRKGAFEKTVKSIETFNHWKNILHSEKPKLDFIMVVNNKNYSQMEDLIRLAKKLNVKSVTFKMVNENPETYGTFSLTQEQMNELRYKIQVMESLAENNSIDLFLDFQISDLNVKGVEPSCKSELFCLMPFFEIVIFSDGKCSPCCIFYERRGQKISKEIVDDISNKSLIQVWNGECFKKLRKMMDKNQPPDVCSSCLPDTKYRHATWEKHVSGYKTRYLR